MTDIQETLDRAFDLGDEGRWEEMASLLNDTLLQEPDDPYLLCWLGVAERELDRPGAAYDLFKRCIALQPTDPQLLSLAGAGLASFDDPDAEPALRTAALSAPDLPFTRLQYGAYLAREGLFDEALQHLDAAVTLAPDDPAMHGERGIALALKGDAAGAIASMELALDIAPEDSWTRLLVGLLRLESGEAEEGATALVEAAAERDTDFEAQILAALAAAAQGWEDRAQEALARADLADEGRDVELLAEVEGRVAVGAEAARDLLSESLAPSILHERLIQPL
jgi:Flp pilus assembly protein TadD